MSSDEPIGWTLFCDDIRVEVGNKRSLIGIYAGDLLVRDPFPITLPKFVIVVSYRIPLDYDHPENLTIGVFLPGEPEDVPTLKMEMPVPDLLEQLRQQDPPGEGAESFTATAHLVASPLVIKQPGRIYVLGIRGENRMRMGSLEVKMQEAAE